MEGAELTVKDGCQSEKETLVVKIKPESKDAVKVPTATFKELFMYATCADGFFMFLGILMAAAQGSSWPLMFLIFGGMTDGFIDYDKNGTTNGSLPANGSDFKDDFEDKMNEYALDYVYIGGGVFVACYFAISLWSTTCERLTLKLRMNFLKALLRQDMAWHDKQQTGELTTRLADDLQRIKEGTGDKVALAVQFTAQFFTGFIIGFIKGWKLSLVIMSLSPLLAIFGGLIGKIMISYANREQEVYAKAGGIAEEVISCMRTVMSFNGQSFEIKKYWRALDDGFRLGIRKSLFTGLSVGCTMLVMFGAYGLAFWFGSTQVEDYQESNGEDGLSPGDVLSVFFSIMIGSFALGSASPHFTSVMTAKGAAGTVVSIIKKKPDIDASDPGGLQPQSLQGYVQLKEVEFSYPTRPDAKVLKKLSLDIEPGQTVALVGASGCGKSTVINLIQRFYDPQEGRVILDGNNIKDLNIHWLRKHIGVVSQEPILFGMSISKNISLGNPSVSMAEIEAAAKKANAHDFICQMPDGYDTLVGERGAQLSGGQKQRVAIARALVRDPRILLLDEATSALDSESEGVVQEALDKARQGRTTIVVAHRLSTIQNADVIYVLEDGVVVEKGQHLELMSQKGVYFKLVTLQTITGRDDDGNGEGNQSNGKAAYKRQSFSKEERRSSLKRQESNNTEESPKKFAMFKTKAAPVEEEEDVAKPGFGRMMKANSPEWVIITFGTINAAINGSIFPLFAIFFSEIIKAYGKTGQDLRDAALLWSLMFVALGVVSFITNLIQSTAFGYSGARFTKRLRGQTFTNIVRQDVEYFDDPKHGTGAITTRLATDASMVQTATGVRLALIVQSVTSMVAGIAIAFIFGWKLAFAVLAGVPILMVSGALQMKLIKGNELRDSELLEEAGKTASECIENIRTVQGLTREQYFYDHYCEQLKKPYRENLKQAQIYGLSSAFSQSMILFLYAAAFRFGAWLVVHDDMEADMVFRVFFAIAFTGMSVGQVSSFLPDYSKAQLSAGHIFHMLDQVPKIDIFNTGGTVKPALTGSLKLKDVHFRYQSRPEVEVLKGVNISVEPGQTAALVGISGCGKSTTMSLIQRYYDPEAGSIEVDGTDLREYNLKAVRSKISVVSQEPVLFDTTIRENILYGLDETLPMADVINAARMANAHDFISNLPDGYETKVGEKGTQLSGGQKQRVAIARALIRNPRILLLDEATSALDSESEKVVQEALDRAREGRTCIVIAHRLTTIQNADIIYAMENGKVEEFGTHQELLAMNGVYSLLVNSQAFKPDDS